MGVSWRAFSWDPELPNLGTKPGLETENWFPKEKEKAYSHITYNLQPKGPKLHFISVNFELLGAGGHQLVGSCSHTEQI